MIELSSGEQRRVNRHFKAQFYHCAACRLHGFDGTQVRHWYWMTHDRGILCEVCPSCGHIRVYSMDVRCFALGHEIRSYGHPCRRPKDRRMCRLLCLPHDRRLSVAGGLCHHLARRGKYLALNHRTMQSVRSFLPWARIDNRIDSPEPTHRCAASTKMPSFWDSSSFQAEVRP